MKKDRVIISQEDTPGNRMDPQVINRVVTYFSTLDTERRRMVWKKRSVTKKDRTDYYYI